MNAPKVILINRMLGYGGLNTSLKGHSGKAYGQPSRYSPEYKCHIVELTLAEYESAREDIFRKMRNSMSGFLLWEPQVILQEAPSNAIPFPPPPINFNPALLNGPVIDEKTPWNDAVKAAKSFGAKVKKGGNRADLLKAVAERREELQQQAQQAAKESTEKLVLASA